MHRWDKRSLVIAIVPAQSFPKLLSNLVSQRSLLERSQATSDGILVAVNYDICSHVSVHEGVLKTLLAVHIHVHYITDPFFTKVHV